MMKFTIQDITINHADQEIIVPKLHVWSCPKTGTYIFDPDTDSSFRYHTAYDYLVSQKTS